MDRKVIGITRNSWHVQYSPHRPNQGRPLGGTWMNATMLRILMMSEDIPSPMQTKIMWGARRLSGETDKIIWSWILARQVSLKDMEYQ